MNNHAALRELLDAIHDNRGLNVIRTLAESVETLLRTAASDGGEALPAKELRCTDPDNCKRCSEGADTPHAGISRGEVPQAVVKPEPVGYIEEYSYEDYPGHQRHVQIIVWGDHPHNTPGHTFTPVYTHQPEVARDAGRQS